MKPDQVLQHRPVVLSEAQRAQYFEKGYLVLPDHVPAAWIERLRVAEWRRDDRAEPFRHPVRTQRTFILEEGHGAEQTPPRLHRVTCLARPASRAFWAQFMARSGHDPDLSSPMSSDRTSSSIAPSST